MIKVIETNLSLYKDGMDTIKDFQSRIIEVNSWDEYVQEIKDSKVVVRSPILGSLRGTTIPHDTKVYDLTYDDFHLDCDVVNQFGIKSKKLAYRVGD